MHYLKYILSFIVLIITCLSWISSSYSLNKISSENIPNQNVDTIVKYGDYFFDFDQVDYYSIDISEDEYDEMIEKDELLESEKLLDKILTYPYPEELTDTLYMKSLIGLGFTKKALSTNKFEDLNNVFREQWNVEQYEYACSPIYRDILIFRNQGQIVGIAKICFSCDQSHIIGTEADLDNFGMNGNYFNLYHILYD